MGKTKRLPSGIVGERNMGLRFMMFWTHSLYLHVLRVALFWHWSFTSSVAKTNVNATAGLFFPQF